VCTRELSALAIIFVDHRDCLTIIVNWRREEQAVCTRKLSALAIFVDHGDCLTIIVNWRREEQAVKSLQIRQTVSTI
jgi:hypothetical protein